MTRKISNSRRTITLPDVAVKLRKGETQEVANMTGYSYSHVNHVINGNRRDVHGVILDAVKLITKGRRK